MSVDTTRTQPHTCFKKSGHCTDRQDCAILAWARRFSRISRTCSSLIRDQSISSHTGVAHEPHSLDSSLSANLIASVSGVSHIHEYYVAYLLSTFFYIKVPRWAAEFDQRIGDTLKIRKRDLAHFQRHVSRTGGKGLHQLPKFGKEGKNITRMASASQLAYLKDLYVGCRPSSNAFSDDNTRSAVSILYSG